MCSSDLVYPFGSCSNHGECEAVCPKGIPLEFIGKMNRDLTRALWRRHREPLVIPGVAQQPFHEHAGDANREPKVVDTKAQQPIHEYAGAEAERS